MPADECTDLSVFESFPTIFSGLGQLKGLPHQIHLTEDARSFRLDNAKTSATPNDSTRLQ